MNWLVIQKRPSKPENEQYGRPWERALKRAGYGVCMYGPGYPQVEARERERADILLYTVDYREEWVPELSGYRMPKIAIFMDSHLNLCNQLKACQRHRFDYIVTHVKRHVKQYRSFARKKAVWLPNAFDPTLCKKVCTTKHADLGFCGSAASKERATWIKELECKMGMKTNIGVIGDRMVETICGYRVHWNRNISHDLNCRTFETTGIGTCLLTNETEGLRDSFDVEKHLIVYTSLADCMEKAKSLINDHVWREAVAEAGYKHAHAHHSYDRRIEQLLEMMGMK